MSIGRREREMVQMDDGTKIDPFEVPFPRVSEKHLVNGQDWWLVEWERDVFKWFRVDHATMTIYGPYDSKPEAA